MKATYNQQPQSIIRELSKEINVFSTDVSRKNIDDSVVESFGEEWKKFHTFSDEELKELGDKYFDIVTDKIVDKSAYCIDIGCGTGRWSKYLSDRAGFIEAIDPSDAIIVADKLLKDIENIRLTKASTDNIPFADESFDFGMSVGVLHHIPDTQKALSDCVQKIKKGGFFYVYLYYALDNRGRFFKILFSFVNFLRRVISSLPHRLKKFFCDVIAVTLYMPIVLLGRLIKKIGFKKLASKLPLSGYHDRSFFIIRNDALDRFGTKLEQRFSKAQITDMMKISGLDEIIISENFPYWHAVGKRVK
jgi:SAM-dependent methyltransferase